jgi:hypothetical protein
MSGVAEIILGLVEAGTTLLGSYWQNEAIDESQEEARLLNERQIAESIATRKSQEKISKEQLRLQKKQLAESTRLTEKQLAMEQEQVAHTRFRDQVSRLTSVLEGNENLKNLYINRLKSLRN